MRQYRLLFIPILVLSCLLFAGCIKISITEVTPDTAAEAAPETIPEEALETAAPADYEQTLFDDSFVHLIDVYLADEDWEDLKENPTEKTKYRADVIIDGEEFKDVSFATKGNSSLFFVASEPGNYRFSFKVKFDKYVDGQTCHGLDTLNLQNSYDDATYMKDYFSYGLFRRTGVPAPLTSYIWVRVNGNDHGLYLAVEDVGESFFNRVYGGEGVIYKPESAGMGLTLELIEEIKKNGLSMESDPHGADLAYIDDAPESYPDIFEHAETADTEEDQRAVIAALKNVAEEKDLDTCLDIGEITRYFAVHNFVQNFDSYTGKMLHNVILYENDGVLAMLPWDYNLAFCAFLPATGVEILDDLTDYLNQGIDTPLAGVTNDERPMWKWIVNSEQYRAEYHGAFDFLILDYFESGEFDQKITELHDMLLPYVEKDPTAFYPAGQFSKACETFRQYCGRRAESIRKQVDGELSCVTEEQEDSDKVDGSDLNLQDMGTFVVRPR